MNRTTTTLWKFHLGDRVRDVASKAAGIIMVRSEYATGCRHYALENGKIDDKGVPHDYIWIDESRLVKTGHVEFPGMSEDPTSAPNRQGDAPRDPR